MNIAMIIVCLVAVIGAFVTSYALSHNALDRVHEAWKHAANAQEYASDRRIKQFESQLQRIEHIASYNAQLARQVSELSAIRLDFDRMKNELLSNVYRGVIEYHRAKDENERPKTGYLGAGTGGKSG